MRLINGHQISQVIHVSASLGIADLLKDGPRPSAEFAEAKVKPQEFYRRISPVAACLGEARLNEPKAGARPLRREPLLMPLTAVRGSHRHEPQLPMALRPVCSPRRSLATALTTHGARVFGRTGEVTPPAHSSTAAASEPTTSARRQFLFYALRVPRVRRGAPGAPRPAATCGDLVQRLDRDREADRGIYIPLRHIKTGSVGDQRHADQQ